MIDLLARIGAVVIAAVFIAGVFGFVLALLVGDEEPEPDPFAEPYGDAPAVGLFGRKEGGE